MNRYRIEWCSKITDAKGHGEWHESKELVDHAVALANSGYSSLSHWRGSEFPEGPQPLRLTFTIDHPGESAAGLPSFTDTVTVEVESGDPGGEEGEFAEYMAQCLREWYDGAKVDRREG